MGQHVPSSRMLGDGAYLTPFTAWVTPASTKQDKWFAQNLSHFHYVLNFAAILLQLLSPLMQLLLVPLLLLLLVLLLLTL